MKHIVSFHDTDCTKSVYYSRLQEWIDPLRLDLFDKYYKNVKQFEADGESFCIYEQGSKLLKRMTIGDVVTIESDSIPSKASFIMEYRFYVEGRLCATAVVKLAYFKFGKLSRMSDELIDAIEKFNSKIDKS